MERFSGPSAHFIQQQVLLALKQLDPVYVLGPSEFEQAALALTAVLHDAIQQRSTAQEG